MVSIASIYELVVLVKDIYDLGTTAKSNRSTCKDMATRVQNLALGPLEQIQVKYSDESLIPQGSRNILNNLKTKLTEVKDYITKIGGQSFLKQLWNQWAFDLQQTLKDLATDIDSCVSDLHLSVSTNTAADIDALMALSRQQNQMMLSLIEEVKSLKAKGVTTLGSDPDSSKFIAEVANKAELDRAALTNQLSDIQSFLQVNVEALLTRVDNLRTMMETQPVVGMFDNPEAKTYWAQNGSSGNLGIRTFCMELRKFFGLSIEVRELMEYFKAQFEEANGFVERSDFNEWTVKVKFTLDKPVFKERLESHIKEWASSLQPTKPEDEPQTVLIKRPMGAPATPQADEDATTVTFGRPMNPQLVAASDRLEIVISNEELLMQSLLPSKPETIPVFMNKLYEGGKRPINRAFTKSFLPWDGGRNPQNNIHISEGDISRFHFTILFSESDNMVKLMDLGSATGTFIKLPSNEFFDVFDDMVIILGSTYFQLSTLNNASGSHQDDDMTVGRPGIRAPARPVAMDDDMTVGRPGVRAAGASSAAPSLCLQVLEQSVSGVYDRSSPESNTRVITPDKGAVVGRLAAKSSIVFSDVVLSRAHAEFKFNAARGKWQLQDLGTPNGSYYQLRPKVAVPLNRNTVFKVGRYNFLVNNTI